MILMSTRWRLLSNTPRFISPRNLEGIGAEFIRNKLEEAYNTGYMNSNSNFVMISRGEGSNDLVQYIKSNDVYTWGVKSMHASTNDYYIQDLLSPHNNSKDFLLQMVNRIQESFMYYVNMKYVNSWKIEINEGQVRNIVRDLESKVENAMCKNELEDIKYQLCLYLHLLNYYDDDVYRSNKIFISGQSGLYRYETAKKYAAGRNNENGEYVILDYWVKKTEITFTFHLAKMLYELINRYGIKWFDSYITALDYEIVSKYVLLPHRLVGYYYFIDDEVQYYSINPNIVDEWRENLEFKIGTDIYVRQDLSTINGNFPYNIIYSIDEKLNYNVIIMLDKQLR